MKTKIENIAKITISTVAVVIALMTAIIAGTITYGNDQEYGNSDIGSGQLYFVSNNEIVTSIPVNETVSLHVSIGLAAGAEADKDYIIKLNNSNFVINGLEKDGDSVEFFSNGNRIRCTIRHNSDGSQYIIVSGWKDGVSLNFDLTGEMVQKGEVIATMDTSKDVYGGQLQANLTAYGDNEISYTNSKSVNHDKIIISSDGSDITDEDGNSLITNGEFLEYILKGNILTNPDNEKITSITVNDTLSIPAGINIDNLETLKKYLSFSGIDESGVKLSVATTDGNHIRTVKIEYTLDLANEINDFLYSQNNKVIFDIVGAIQDCGEYIQKGSTITLTNSLQTNYTSTYHEGTAEQVTVNTDITKEEGSKFEFDKKIQNVNDANNTYNNGEGYVVVGDTITFYMTIENTGTDSGEVTFSDNAPWGTEITNVSIVSSTGASNVKWQQSIYDSNKAEGSATIAEGGKIVVAMTVKVTYDSTRTIRNDLYSNNTSVAHATIDQRKKVDLAISKIADSYNVDKGGIVTYTITVTNSGVESITTDVIDYIPEGITITDTNGGVLTTLTNDDGSTSPVIAWRDVTINAGETITYTIKATVDNDAEGYIKNQVVVDEGTENEKWADTSIYVKDLENQTGINKLVNGSTHIQANNGDSIEYTIEIRNNSDTYNLDEIGGSIVITDEIPAEIEWDINDVYYVININGTKYTSNITRNGNILTWVIDNIGEEGKVFTAFRVITLHIPGTIKIDNPTDSVQIVNTAKSETLNKESSAIIDVELPEDVLLEKYVYKIYDENDNLIYTNTTGGKVESIDVPVSENYTVVYRLKIKNIGETVIDSLTVTDQTIYPYGAEQQLFINNYYYTNIDTTDTNIVQPSDANILVVKQYDSEGNYNGYFTSPVIYWWGNTSLSTEDLSVEYDPYTKCYSEGIGEFALAPNDEVTWEYSFKTTNNNFQQVTNQITNKSDNKIYTSETLYAPKRVKSIDKKVALIDQNNINTNNYYTDQLNLLHSGMEGKYFIYQISLETEGFVDDVLTINDSFVNNNLSYVTSDENANFPVVQVTRATSATGDNLIDFTTYSATVNDKNLSITLNPAEDSSGYYNLYYNIYYLVKINDNVTENIDSINTASITYRNETLSDTAEVVILQEQIYPGIQKAYQGTFYSGTSKTDDTGYNPKLSEGATAGAHIVWKVTLTNSISSNAKNMTNYTLTDILPTGYEYDDNYLDDTYEEAKYYPSIVIYDNNGNVTKTMNAHDGSYLEPLLSTTIEENVEKQVLTWMFNDNEYTLKPGYKMEIIFSTKTDTAMSGRFENNSYLTIEDGFENANVCYGDVQLFNGEKAIHASDYVTTYLASVTTSYKEVETLYSEDSELYDYASGSSSKNTIKGIAGEDVKYTLNVKNDSPDSIAKLVVIDRLPYLNDKYILTSENMRNSAFEINYKNVSKIRLNRVNQVTGKESVEILENSKDFIIEFSSEKEQIFNGECTDWQGENQIGNWHSGYETGDVNIRFIFNDDIYLDPEESIEIELICSVPNKENLGATGESHVAWNNFGYCYTSVKYEDKTEVLSENIVAEPDSVGVWVEEHNTKVKLIKNWNDNNDLHGVRPDSIQIQLKKRYVGEEEYIAVGNPITIERNLYELATDSSKWSYTFEELPEYENGKKLEYTIEELIYGNNYTHISTTTNETEDGYEVIIENKEETGTLLINKIVKLNDQNITSTIKDTFYFVIKTSDNKYVLHDSSGNVYLEEISSLPVSGKLNDAIWIMDMEKTNILEVSNLPIDNTYQVIEVTADGNVVNSNNSYYDVTYSSSQETLSKARSNTNITVTNSLKTIDVTLTKKWEDLNNIHGIRPDEIKIQLYANGEKYGEEVTLTSENVSDSDNNIWTYTFNNLRKYDEDGNEIAYTIEEVSSDISYSKETTVVDKNNVTIVNTELVGSITVTKQLINNNDDITDTADRIFYFVVKQGDKYIDKNGESKQNVDTNCIFSIKTGPYGDNEYSKTVYDLVIGETYTVIEVDENGNEINSNTSDFTVSYKNQTVEITNENNSANCTIINNLDTTSLKIVKNWEDNNNIHNLRKEVTVHLKADNVEIQTIVLNESNNWTATISGLTKYRNDGQTEIVYSVEEDKINGYTQGANSITYDSDGTKIITLNNIEETGSIILKKFVQDNYGNNIGSNISEEFKGPYYVTIIRNDNQKYIDENGIESSEKRVIQINANEEKTIEGMALTNYTICETTQTGDNVENNPEFTSKLTVTYSSTDILLTEESISATVTITNKINKTTSIDVTKVWEDQNDTSYRPVELEVTLYANSDIAKDINGNQMIYKLTDADKLENDEFTWKHTFKDLPVYDKNGFEITYTVTENLAGDYYDSVIDTNTMTITNTLSEKYEKVGLTITKYWDNNGNNNEVNYRPESVMFIIRRTDTNSEVRRVTLTSDTNWTYSCDDLSKYNENSEEIVYEVYEVIPNTEEFKYYDTSDKIELNGEFVRKAITADNKNFNIKNDFEVPEDKINITVNKIWEADNDLIPDFINVTLISKVDNTEIGRETISILKQYCEVTNNEQNWKYVIKDLPKYDINTGKEINYSVEENKLNNFESSIVSSDYSSDNKSVTFKNTLKTGSITVNKIVRNSDSIDITNTINETYYFIVKTEEKYVDVNGSIVDEPVIFAITTGKNENDYSVTINNLSIDKKYTIIETDSKGNKFEDLENDYIISYSPIDSVDLSESVLNGTITIENKLTTKKIIVNKVWDDDNNKYQKRPDSIKLVISKNINGSETKEERIVNVSECTVENNIWTYIIENLPIYDDYGNKISYGIDEIEDYEWYYKSEDTIETTENGAEKYIITNSEVLGNYSLDLEKIDEKGTSIPGIEFNINGISRITNDNGKIIIVDNKEIYDDTTEPVTIEEISYTGEDGIKKYIKLKEKLTLYISKQRVENECVITGISFDNNEFDTQISEFVQIENDEEIEVSANVQDNDITITIPNIEQKFDLSLRKFITKVNDTELELRAPTFISKNDGTYEYSKNEALVEVENNDLVTYTIRVYNEGNVHGYASRVEDDIPKGLEFVTDNETNIVYKWNMIDENGNITTDTSKAVKIQTSYLSKENGEEIDGRNSNLIKSYNPDTMNSPDYKDIKVVFKIVEPEASKKIIENKAQIIKSTDYHNEEAIDIDSTANEWINGEDDQDIEKIRPKYFDLSLDKDISKIIVSVNGKEDIINVDEEDIPKIDLKSSQIDKTIIKIEYNITVKNKGEIPGYAKKIVDYLPNGFEFNENENTEWYVQNGDLITDQLEDTILNPGESVTISLILTWKNSSSNLGLKVNTAEILEDYNSSETPDTDSTPGNKVETEDDISNAQVMITIKTGGAMNVITIANWILGILAISIIVIDNLKKKNK